MFTSHCKKEKDKFLITDASGFDPIRYSIRENWMTLSDLELFQGKNKIRMCATSCALEAGEFSYSEVPNLFTCHNFSCGRDAISPIINGTSVKNCWVIFNGTVTTDRSFSDGLRFDVFHCDCDSPHTFIQKNLWQSSNSWEKLSPQDCSEIFLAEKMSANITKNNIAILANDWSLREQANFSGILVYGSSSLLAGMVIDGIYSVQKATSLFYKWEKIDRKWVPKNNNFKNVLDKEKERYKNKESFWVK